MAVKSGTPRKCLLVQFNSSDNYLFSFDFLGDNEGTFIFEQLRDEEEIDKCVEEFQNEEEVENVRSSITKCDLNHEVCWGSIMSVKKFTEIIQKGSIIFNS
jgi:hypothetical protein